MKSFIVYKEKLIGFTLDEGETILYNNSKEAQEIKLLLENNTPFDLKNIVKITRTDFSSKVKVIGYNLLLKPKNMSKPTNIIDEFIC